MARSAGENSLNIIVLLSVVPHRQISPLVVVFGVLMFTAGIVLMIRHLRLWQEIQANEAEIRVRKFELRKFRRRGIVACLLSISGSAMAALYWAVEAQVFAILTSILIAAILGIFGLAVLDLIGVSLSLAEPDDAARKRMVEEVRLLKEKQRQKELEEADQQDQ